jgi:uncharacterized SAM-binding protein YcdF (DUF218 family)
VVRCQLSAFSFFVLRLLCFFAAIPSADFRMYQFFAPLTEPVGAIWGLMVFGVVWRLCRRQWRSAIWLGCPTVLLFIIGGTPLAEILVASEERQWVGGRPGEIQNPISQAKESGQVKQLTSLLEYGTDPTGQADFTGQGKQPGEVTNTDFTGQGKSAIGNGSQVSAFSLQPSAFPFDAVVALGGGERVSQHDLLGFAMEDGGSRSLTAIQLVRSGKARTLVLGGSWPMPDRPDVPSMSVVQNWATAWGLVGGAVTNLGICINTHDEAVAFKKLARSQGWSKVLLVTSALHLRRSVALFQKQGMAVTPVAADFQVWGVPPDPFSPFPRQHRFFLLALYLHEKIGWWVYHARGWV